MSLIKLSFLTVLACFVCIYLFAQNNSTKRKKRIKSIEEIQYEIRKRTDGSSVIDTLYDGRVDMNGKRPFGEYCSCEGVLVECSNENTLTIFDELVNIIQISYYDEYPEYNKDYSKIIRIPIKKTVLYKDILKDEQEEENHKKRFMIKVDSSYNEKTKLKLVKKEEWLKKEEGGYELFIIRKDYYDLNGKLIANLTNYGGNDPDSTIYIYNSKNHLIAHTTFYGGSSYSKTIYRYNNQNELIEQIEFKNDDERWHKTSIQKFQNNRVIEISYFDKKIIEREKYVYGSKGEIIKSFYYHQEGISLDFYNIGIDKVVKEVKKTFIYKYDSYDNWIERTILINDVPCKFAKRKIEYFN